MKAYKTHLRSILVPDGIDRDPQREKKTVTFKLTFKKKKLEEKEEK